jgi:RHS repeat-associated protein
MGRLTAEHQCPNSAACATPYAFSYVYNLAGNVTSSNNGLANPSPSLTFGFSYDGADHMSSAGTTSQPSSWSSTTYPQALQQATQTAPGAYDPMGHLVNVQLGLASANATPALTLARQYDNRGRIILETENSATFYQIPSQGYAPNGNLLKLNDSIIGDWSFGYDTLNRLTSGVPRSGPFLSEYGCWTYDSFGNRTLEALSSLTLTPCAPGADDNAIFTPLTPIPGTNRVTNFVYDGAGNVIYDGSNEYAYDADGRLCEVAVNLTGQTSYYQYLYDAEGRRVAKGSTTSKSCGAPTSANGFLLSNQYLLGLNGEQVTELALVNGKMGPDHTNVWTGGGQLNTYDLANGGLHFALTDLLGTKRIQVSGTGVLELTCASLPFGNSIWKFRSTACNPWGKSTAPDATEHHYTGKERDTESGLDYFGARYYSSGAGRFLSPDYNAMGDDLDPVPYADLNNPQSLNLYSYVQNNPLSHKDADGHKCDGGSVGPDGTFTFHCTNDPPPIPNGTVYQLAGALGLGFAPETGGASLGIAAGFAGAMLAAEYLAAHPIHLSSSNEPAPTTPGTAPSAPVPSGLVGTQDGKSGQAGGRHNSGPLDPAHGGSGDAARDFNTLTGGKAGPAPAGSNYPPGTQVGDNGISLRPARGNSGPRIDIPANGDKPHETLHYPN